MEREDFGKRRGIDEVKDDSPPASIVGIAIPALVIAGAAAVYLLLPGSDNQFSQADVTPPAATTQEAPKANPDAINATPDAEKKAPPAAEPKANDVRDPRTDSQNAN